MRYNFALSGTKGFHYCPSPSEGGQNQVLKGGMMELGVLKKTKGVLRLPLHAMDVAIGNARIYFLMTLKYFVFNLAR